MKREIYPRHKAECPNGKAKRPRKKFDGCRVYARYTITDPNTGKLLEDFNGALPPHITTKTAADTYVNQRFALVIDEHQRGGKVPTIDRGMTVKAARLNQAEIEIGLFSRQCLGTRRIPDLKSLR